MSDYPTVTIGDRDIEVKPQTYPRLKRDLKRLLGRLPELGVAFEDLTEMSEILEVVLGEGGTFAYDALCMLIPGVKRHIAYYVFEGYTSQDALDVDEDGPDADPETMPTIPQLRRAFEVGIQVNDLDFLAAKLAKLSSKS